VAAYAEKGLLLWLVGKERDMKPSHYLSQTVECLRCQSASLYEFVRHNSHLFFGRISTGPETEEFNNFAADIERMTYLAGTIVDDLRKLEAKRTLSQ